MSDPKPLTALERIAENSSLSFKAKCNAIDRKEKATPTDMESYYSGEVIGYSDSYLIMAKELRRLKNLFQNGALTIEDFGVY